MISGTWKVLNSYLVEWKEKNADLYLIKLLVGNFISIFLTTKDVTSLKHSLLVTVLLQCCRVLDGSQKLSPCLEHTSKRDGSTCSFHFVMLRNSVWQGLNFELSPGWEEASLYAPMLNMEPCPGSHATTCVLAPWQCGPMCPDSHVSVHPCALAVMLVWTYVSGSHASVDP